MKILNKIRSFEIESSVLTFWEKESAATKTGFLSTLIIGFVSNLFVYTGRYFGRDDLGRIYLDAKGISTGRWIFVDNIAYGYVVPLVYGILVSLFIAVSAYYICKLFDIRKKTSAFLIGGLMSTFPTIANANMFLYATVTFSVAILMAVLAVYIAVRFKYGFLAGGVLTMLVLATYQANLNIILALCLFYLLLQLLDETKGVKDILKWIGKFLGMIFLGTILYAISLSFFDNVFTGYRGFSVDNMREQVLSVSGFIGALKSTYLNFYEGFFGHIYMIVRELKYIYLLIIVISALFFILIVIHKKLHKSPSRLIFAAALIALTPFACNFSDFFTIDDAYTLMIYAFVLTFVFAITLYERCTNVFPVIKSAFAVCMVLVIVNYVIINNVYYLQAYYFDKRTESITTRILDRVDPLLTNTTQNRIGLFGALPNEYYPQSSEMFREHGPINDGAAVFGRNYIGYNDFRVNSKFTDNVNRFHGLRLTPLSDETNDEEKRLLRKKILDTNMPAWPAEGSVDIIDDVIVVNLGISDIVLEEDEDGQYFRARHWVSEGHANNKYTYVWHLYKNGSHSRGPIKGSEKLYIDVPKTNDSYRVMVVVKNNAAGFNYHGTSFEFKYDELASKWVQSPIEKKN